MLKMTIDNEEVVSDKDITINEEMLSASSSILNNVYPKEWEEDKDYTSRFYYPQDYSKALIQRSYVTQEAEAGTTIQVNGSATLTDVDTTKNSRVLRLLGQTSQTGTPTPSSPIPVNVVSGDNEIVVCGKNLYDNELNPSVKQRNCTATYTNGEIVVSATGTDCYYGEITNAGGSWDITKGQLIKVSPNTQYFFNVSNTNFTKNFISYYDKNKVSVNATGIGRNNTFTTGNDVEFVSFRVGYGNSVSGTTYKLNVMLNKGNAGETYEPYIGNTYNIDLPVENLIQIKTDLNVTQNGLQFKYESDGAVSITGTASSTSDYYIPLQSNIILDNNTYTFSCMCDGSIGANDGSIRFVASGGISFGNTFKAIVSNSQVYITAQNTTSNEYKFCLFSFVSGKSYNIKLYFQLEKGTKANSYTPYGTTPIELCKIGNYQDYIYKDSDKWYLHKEIGKVVFTGGSDETWNIGNNNFGKRFDTNISNSLQSDLTNGAKSLCNYLSLTAVGGTYVNKNCYTISSDSKLFVALDETFTTLEQFKTWLSTHNIYLYYVLTTPTNTEITYTKLLNQLNALSSQ